MAKIPRVRERTATAQERTASPTELAEDTERCRRAREAHRPLAPVQEGNLVKCLVVFARWRQCCTCQSLVLYVNANARTTGDVECKTCIGLREDLARRLRPARPSLPMRAALHLRALFSTGNDNGVRA
jgi:hypothetical protein